MDRAFVVRNDNYRWQCCCTVTLVGRECEIEDCRRVGVVGRTAGVDIDAVVGCNDDNIDTQYSVEYPSFLRSCWAQNDNRKDALPGVQKLVFVSKRQFCQLLQYPKSILKL